MATTFTFHALVSFLLYSILNVSLSFTNKYMFTHTTFRYPLLIIIGGNLTTFVLAGALIATGKVGSAQYADIREAAGAILALGIIHGIDVGLENMSLVYISISLNQIIKAVVPAFTLVLSYYLQGAVYTRQMVASTALTIFGTILCVWKNPEVEGDGRYGVLAASLSALGAALSTVGASVLLEPSRRRKPVNSMALAWITALPSAAVLLPPFGMIEYPAIVHRIANHNLSSLGVGLAFLTALLAFFYNVSRLYFIKATEAHFSVLSGAFKQAANIIISSWYFGIAFGPINYVGMFISFGGFTWYTVLKFQQMKRAKELARLARATDDTNSIPLTEPEIETIDT